MEEIMAKADISKKKIQFLKMNLFFLEGGRVHTKRTHRQWRYFLLQKKPNISFFVVLISVAFCSLRSLEKCMYYYGVQ